MDGELNLDLSEALASIERIKEMKAVKAKESTSTKPLKFEVSSKDSELKKILIEKINEENLTYSDLFKYCTLIAGGDISAGKTLGYNTINGLRKGKSLTDVTMHMLWDFLGYDIIFKKRGEPKDDDQE